jgi:hypothetical protein
MKLKKTTYYSLAVFLLVLISFYIFSESEGIYSSYDSASFAISTLDYNLKENLPHMPGYYFHIKLIDAMKNITGSTHSAMIWLNLLYSAFGGVFSFLIFRKFVSENDSFIITLLVMTNPMTWYYGCSAGVYPFDLFYSTLIVLLGMNRRMIYLTPVILTLGAGVRQSSGFFMFPIVLYFFISSYRSKQIKVLPLALSIILAFAGFLVWALPMLENAGGLSNYLSLFQENSPLSMRHAFMKNFTNAITYGFYIFTPLFLILVHALLKNNVKSIISNLKNEGFSRMRMLFLLWPLPITVFFLLFVYSKGYFLICISGIMLIPVFLLKYKLIKRYVIVLIIIFQTAFFLLMPYSDAELYVNMAPDKRQTGKIEAWMGRLSNVFMLSQDAIRKREIHGDEIRKCIDILKDKSYLENHVLFIDPSFPIKARVLQAVYPDVNFAFLNVYENDSYFSLFHTKFATRYGLNEIISRSIILTSKELYENYLIDKEYKLIYKTSDILCFDPKSDIQSIIGLYYEYYIRSD